MNMAKKEVRKMGKEWTKNMLNAKVMVSTLLVCMVVASCLVATVSAGPPEKTPVIGGGIKYE